MRAQEPDGVAARTLFTELEFNTLVQDFLTESIELGETNYRDAKEAAEVKAAIAAASKPGKMLAIALESSANASAGNTDAENTEDAESEQMSLTPSAPPVVVRAASHRIAISANAGEALTVAIEDEKAAAPLRKALADEALVKTVHDYKSATHVFHEAGVDSPE